MDNIFKSFSLGKTIQEMEFGPLEKAQGDSKSNHKYIKRTGAAGNYKYWYKLPNGHVVSSDSADGPPHVDHEKKMDMDERHGEKNPNAPEGDIESAAHEDGALGEEPKDKDKDGVSDDLEAKIEKVKKKYKDAIEMAEHLQEKKKQLADEESSPRYKQAIDNEWKVAEQALAELNDLRGQVDSNADNDWEAEEEPKKPDNDKQDKELKDSAKKRTEDFNSKENEATQKRKSDEDDNKFDVGQEVLDPTSKVDSYKDIGTVAKVNEDGTLNIKYPSGHEFKNIHPDKVQKYENKVGEKDSKETKSADSKKDDSDGDKIKGKKPSSIEVKDYSWGKLRKVELGNSIKAIIHPEHWTSIMHTATSGDSTNFIDEQGINWQVTKEGDGVNLKPDESRSNKSISLSKKDLDKLSSGDSNNKETKLADSKKNDESKTSNKMKVGHDKTSISIPDDVADVIKRAKSKGLSPKEIVESIKDETNWFDKYNKKTGGNEFNLRDDLENHLNNSKDVKKSEGENNMFKSFRLGPTILEHDTEVEFGKSLDEKVQSHFDQREEQFKKSTSLEVFFDEKKDQKVDDILKSESPKFVDKTRNDVISMLHLEHQFKDKADTMF